MLGEAVVRVVDLSQDGFSEQHRRSAHLQRECARRRWHSSAHRTSERRWKSLLRKEKRLRVNMEIAREKSTVIIR